MRSKAATKSFFLFALRLMLAAWALPAGDAMAKTVILGGGAVAFEIVGEVDNSGPGIVPATSEIFGYLSRVDGIDQVFTDSDPTHQNESTALITFDTDATTIRVTPHGPFRIIDRDGTTTMYVNNGPSNFSDPSTFRQGTPFQVSSFHQQVIVDTVESTFTVVNTNTVTSSSKFTIGGINYLLDKPGRNLRTVLQGVLSTRNAGSPPPTGFFSGYAVEADN